MHNMNNKITISTEKSKTSDVYVGQFYYHMRLKQVFIVALTTPAEYCLIGLIDGNRWNNPCKDVKKIFNGDKDKFELVTSSFTVTPGE